jgi:hypothetical protein
MAVGAKSTNENNEVEQKKTMIFISTSPGVIGADIIARWVVDLIAIPISFITAIFAQFAERNGAGAKILGSLAFWIGTLLSTDSIWQ